MVKIMNMFNIIVQDKLIYLNILLHVDKCVLFMPGHDLNSNASSGHLSLSRSCYGCTWNSKIAYLLVLLVVVRQHLIGSQVLTWCPPL